MRIVAGLEYDGAPFCGWQSQKNGCGVQDEIRRALSFANGAPPIVHAAGRTDAGVHASLQIVHFDAAVSRTGEVWRRAANAVLPKQARLLWARKAADDFHARYSAVRRRYRYVVLNRPAPPGLMHTFAAHCSEPLNAAAMRTAARFLCGTHDFSAFRAASCQAKTPFRTVETATVRRRGEWLFLDFCADGFLHKMVRNIVGALLLVGCGRQKPEWIFELLQTKTRALCPPPAPPRGLYFTGAQYPPHLAPPEMYRPPFLPASAVR